jgi:hypothetical protein
MAFLGGFYRIFFMVGYLEHIIPLPDPEVPLLLLIFGSRERGGFCNIPASRTFLTTNLVFTLLNAIYGTDWADSLSKETFLEH